MKSLSVLPNFTILADCNEYYESQLMGILRCFCEVVSAVEHVDNYRITPASFWQGMNVTQDLEFDFVQMLKDNSKEEIPGNVLKELEGFVERYGTVTLVGDDCLLVNNNDLLEEIKNSSSLDNIIYNAQGNALFFKGSVAKLQEQFQYEFNFPIKYHISATKTFVIEDGRKRFAVKASSAVEALRSLYNNHPHLDEFDLKLQLNHKKNEVSEEDVNEYISMLVETPSKASCSLEIKEVPYQSIFERITF